MFVCSVRVDRGLAARQRPKRPVERGHSEEEECPWRERLRFDCPMPKHLGRNMTPDVHNPATWTGLSCLDD